MAVTGISLMENRFKEAACLLRLKRLMTRDLNRWESGLPLDRAAFIEQGSGESRVVADMR